MSDTAYRTDIPDCDICKMDGVTTPAYADASLSFNGRRTWGFACLPHFNQHEGALGMGRGQRLLLVGETIEEHTARIERTLSARAESVLIEDEDEDEDPIVDTVFYSREHEAAAKYLSDLIRKRDEAHAKIPLSDAERTSWNRRIAKASVIMNNNAMKAKK